MAILGTQPLSGQFRKLDSITPNGSASYTLQFNGTDFIPPQPEALIVSVNGVTQSPNTSYNLNNATITFTSALVNGTDVIDYIISMGETGIAQTVSDGTINANKLADSVALSSTPIRVNTNTISSSHTIASGSNAFVAGPITISNSVTIVVNGTFTVV
jgi:hypothetical protein